MRPLWTMLAILVAVLGAPEPAAAQCSTSAGLEDGPSCVRVGHVYACVRTARNCTNGAQNTSGLPCGGFQAGDSESEAAAEAACGRECIPCDGSCAPYGTACAGEVAPPDLACGGAGDDCACGTSAGEGPILVPSGAMYLKPLTDFAFRAPHGQIELTRSYRTDDLRTRMREGRLMGPGWRVSYDDEVRGTVNADVEWIREDGARIPFHRGPSGGPAFYAATDRLERLEEDAGLHEFRVIAADRSERRIFHQFVEQGLGNTSYRLAAIQRPTRSGAGWRDLLRVVRWSDAYAPTDPCFSALPELANHLCRVELLDAAGTGVLGSLTYQVALESNRCLEGRLRPYLTGATWQLGVQAPVTIASYTYASLPEELDSDFSVGYGCPVYKEGFTTPEVTSRRPARSLIAAEAEAGDGLQLYRYEIERTPGGGVLSIQNPPYLTEVEDAAGVILERHTYTSGEGGTCAADADCPFGQSCYDSGTYCVGPRRVTRSETDCSGPNPQDCAESLAFLFDAGATRIEPEGREAWEVQYDDAGRVTAVDGNLCRRGRSYVWTDVDTSPTTQRRIESELMFGAADAPRYRWRSYDGGSPRPRIVVEGDDDPNPDVNAASDPLPAGATRVEYEVDALDRITRRADVTTGLVTIYD